MNFKAAVEKRWYSSSAGWLLIFYPLERLFRSISDRRRQKLLAEQQSLSVPVVIVGNITVGGTGKTPLLIALGKHLKALGIPFGVISRGYGRSSKGLKRLSEGSSASEVGDEPLEIFRALSAPVYVSENRVEAARALIQKHDIQLILSDDGLQHYQLPRQLELIVVDAERGTGNGHLLPVGPLRESVQRLKRVDWVIYNGRDDRNVDFDDASANKSFTMTVTGRHWQNIYSGDRCALDALNDQDIHAFAGIGNPNKFFSLLESHGVSFNPEPRADHYVYSAADFKGLEEKCIVMTPKDAVKCHAFAPANTWFLNIQAQLPDRFFQQFETKIRALLDQK